MPPSCKAVAPSASKSKSATVKSPRAAWRKASCSERVNQHKEMPDQIPKTVAGTVDATVTTDTPDGAKAVAGTLEATVHLPDLPAPSLKPDTTAEQDLTTAGQRHVNLLWESTQGKIAVYVIIGTLVVDGAAVLVSMLFSKDMTAAQGLSLGFLNSLATGVTSFYFSRTNHAAIGGIGPKATDIQNYAGR